MKVKRFWNTEKRKEWQEGQYSFYKKDSINKQYFDIVVDWIKTELNVKFQLVKKESQCEYCQTDNTIRCIENLSMMLHEAGHAALKHEPAYNVTLKKVIQSDKEIYRLEVEAWDEGFEIMKELNISDSSYGIYAEECLETYVC